MRHVAIVAAALLALPATAAGTPAKQYKLKPHASCRVHYVKRVETVKERRHGKVVKVKETYCVYLAPTLGASPAAPVLAVRLDPSFTQSPTNPLDVTYTYSASATVGGKPDQSLPSGVLEFFSDGLLACSENVGGQIDSGTCEVLYQNFGAHIVNTIYDSGTNSATTGNEIESIEPPSPPAITIPETWGTSSPTGDPSATITVSGSTAQVTVSDADWEGATSVGLTDQLGDSCQALVSSATASCSMHVTGAPSSLSLFYPGGATTQGTQTVSPWGVPQTQEVTYTWPSENVAISGAALTLNTVLLAVSVDASFTQSPTNPYGVTYGFSASSTINGSPETSLPYGVVEFYSDGLPACSVNVGGQTNTGSCEVIYSAFGAHTVSAVYSSGTNSATTGSDDESIEPPPPPPLTVPETWGTTAPTASPSATVTISGPLAEVAVTDPNWEGATLVDLSDQLGDTCEASVAGTTASCSMSVTGTLTSLSAAYPGGTTTYGTQTVSPWGVPQTQNVTYTWSSQNVTITGGALTVNTAPTLVIWGNWYATGYAGGSPNPPPPGTITIPASGTVHLFVISTGDDSADAYPLGSIDFTITPTPGSATYNESNEFFGSSDCSASQNYSGQAEAGCDLTFNGAGTYAVTTEYVTDDPNYTDLPGPSETIDVTP